MVMGLSMLEFLKSVVSPINIINCIRGVILVKHVQFQCIFPHMKAPASLSLLEGHLDPDSRHQVDTSTQYIMFSGTPHTGAFAASLSGTRLLMKLLTSQGNFTDT